MTVPFALIFWPMMVTYALSVGAQIAVVVLRQERWAPSARWGTRIGIVLHSALIVYRWVQTGHMPAIGTFENALFASWFLAVMAVWAGWRERFPAVTAAALPFALLVLGGAALADPAPSPLVASLNTFWLYIHIFFAWLAYGAFTVACGGGIVLLARTRRGGAPPPETLAKLDEIMFRSTAFGFVTEAIMIGAGAIWAKSLWGSYWSWDPVETWSLLTWIVYGLALHLRTTLGWRGRRLAWVLVFAVVTVIVTAWGVNLVMVGSSHVLNVG